MRECPVTTFNAWTHAIAFAGITGAVHFRCVDGVWRDHRLDRALEIMNKGNIDFKVTKNGEVFEAWTYE